MAHSGVNATTTRNRLPQNSRVIKDFLENCHESISLQSSRGDYCCHGSGGGKPGVIRPIGLPDIPTSRRNSGLFGLGRRPRCNHRDCYIMDCSDNHRIFPREIVRERLRSGLVGAASGRWPSKQPRALCETRHRERAVCASTGSASPAAVFALGQQAPGDNTRWRLKTELGLEACNVARCLHVVEGG